MVQKTQNETKCFNYPSNQTNLQHKQNDYLWLNIQRFSMQPALQPNPYQWYRTSRTIDMESFEPQKTDICHILVFQFLRIMLTLINRKILNRVVKIFSYAESSYTESFLTITYPTVWLMLDLNANSSSWIPFYFPYFLPFRIVRTITTNPANLCADTCP